MILLNNRYGKWLDEVLIDGIAGRGTARGDLNLTVDRGQVPVHGAARDDQLFGYLGIGQPLSHELQHLYFAFGEASRIGRRRYGCLQR